MGVTGVWISTSFEEAINYARHRSGWPHASQEESIPVVFHVEIPKGIPLRVRVPSTVSNAELGKKVVVWGGGSTYHIRGDDESILPEWIKGYTVINKDETTTYTKLHEEKNKLEGVAIYVPMLIKIESIVTEGGSGSGNYGHAGRPGEVGGSGGGGGGENAGDGVKSLSKDEFDVLEDKVVNSSDYDHFSRQASKWTAAFDSDARELAISIVQDNPDLHSYLLHKVFGLDVPKEITLYRVGTLRGEGTNSFWASKGAADAYQKRMGVDRIHAFIVPAMQIISSESGAGEVWAVGGEYREVDLETIESITEGGSGSGNFGHAGRPGEVGGSGEGGGAGAGGIAGGTSDQKALLRKIVKGLPKQAIEGTKIKIGQPLSSEYQEAEYNPYSKEIVISPKLLDSKFFSDNKMGMAYSAKHPEELVVISASFAEKFDLKQGDNTNEYKTNIVAHEVGHAVWHNLNSNEQEHFVKAFSNLNTYTTGAYSRYWTDRASGEVSGVGDARYALMMKDRKLGSERFAEAFRLYVTKGRYAREFQRIKSKIGEQVTEGSASAEKLSSKIKIIREYVKYKTGGN